MIEAFSYGFIQNAFLAAILASIACGLIGTMVVINRMVFLAGGVAHTAYGGVGLAFFLGLPVMPCTIAFTTVASLLMANFTFRQRRQTETIIGMFWAAGMAIGILLMDCTPGYHVNLMSYLFGSILTVSSFDIWVMIGLNIFLLMAILIFYKDFAAMSFDEEFALSRGAPVKFLYFLLMAMIAVSVVMIIQVVGLILVIALLTIPPYLAQLRISSLGQMMMKATLWSLVFCLFGLWLAYRFDLTSGATIIAVATGSFFVVYVLRKFKVIGTSF